MKSYRSVLDSVDRFENENLSGALSPLQGFHYTSTYEPERETISMYKSISNTETVLNNYNIDKDNNIITNEFGAVADAYDFSKLSESEISEAIQAIILEKKLCYPDYEFTIAPGEFPIDIDGGMESLYHYSGDKVILSTHVLYISDYPKHLKKSKSK